MALLRRKDNPEARMSLVDHFKEFRNRAAVALGAVLIASIYGWLKFDTVYNWLQQPMVAVARERHVTSAQVNINFGGNGVSDAFGIKIKVAMWIGLLISSPIWLWEIWAFLAPGLHKKEKRIGLAFIGAAIPLFAAGCWTATRALPNAIKFLLGVTPDGAVNYTDAQVYITFCTKFILVFGLAFLLPVFLVGLNAAGVLPARAMLKGWRPATMLIFVFAAAMSPSPDAWSMLVLAFPMVGLYFLAIGVAMVIERRKKRARPQWLDVPDDSASTL